MEKDNRSHTKRSRMRAFKKNHYQKISQQNSNNSPIEIGLIDVADSSDDRFSYRSSQWSPASDIDDEELQQIGGDFEILQNMPISGGSGHFQFSSEKNWENDNDTTNILEKTEASEYFTLNLALLNAGLQTIPFYKRMDYPGIFNKADINLMNQEAEFAESKYHELLKEHEKGIKNKPSSGKRQTSAAKSTKSDKNSVVVTPAAVEEKSQLQNDTKDAELDELLSLTTNNIAKVSFNDGDNPTDSTVNPDNNDTKAGVQTDESKNIETGNKEDIQQWLDDILE